MTDKHCSGCNYCGMDMDMEPFCVNKSVIAKRTQETGKKYPWGLDTNRAWPLCKAKHWKKRK